jgi:Predicted glycosyltransferases
VSVLSSAIHSVRSDFARIICRKLQAGRFLVIDGHPAKLEREFTRNCSAVSAACMLTRRDVFQEIGGFDESLPDPFADIDICLKIRRRGYLIVYSPFAKLYKHEPPADKIDVGGEAIMRERWPDVVHHDPYYNANLSRERADFSLGK